MSRTGQKVINYLSFFACCAVVLLATMGNAAISDIVAAAKIEDPLVGAKELCTGNS